MRRLHGRAIERAYQTGQDVSVCTSRSGEESYYVHDKPPTPKPKDEKRKGEDDGEKD